MDKKIIRSHLHKETFNGKIPKEGREIALELILGMVLGMIPGMIGGMILGPVMMRKIRNWRNSTRTKKMLKELATLKRQENLV